MPVYISTLDIPPASASAVLNTLAQQNRATTSWDSLVDVPKGAALWHDKPLPVHGGLPLGNNEDPAFGIWVPIRTSRQREGSAWTQVTRWSRQTVPATGEGRRRLADLLKKQEHMLAQAKRLTRAVADQSIINALLTSDLSPATLVQQAIAAEPDSNALGVWNSLLLGGPKAGPVHDALAAVALANEGRLLMNLILADLTNAKRLNEVVRVLADYQLCLDPAPANFGDLAFLLERGDPVALEQIADWSDDEDELDPATQPISCVYIDPAPVVFVGNLPRLSDAGQSVLTLPEPTPTSLPPLFVEEPANSRAEAELEIALQRAHLTAEHLTAGASVPLDPTIKPLDTVSAEGKVWKVTRVTHRWPAGTAPETTELQLRAI